MNFTIEAANDGAALASACDIRTQVFGADCFRRLPRLDGYDPGQILTLMARSEDTNEPAATLTVVETTADAGLHIALGLSFPEGVRVARYTQLAVLKAYRGLKLPGRLISEARRRFVEPNRIQYSWLLYNADAARSSSLCRQLGFKCGDQEFVTEYGRSRLLVRNEQIANEGLTGQRSQWNAGTNRLPNYMIPQAVAENEWLAH